MRVIDSKWYFRWSFAHFKIHLRPVHGPQVWKWWQWVSFSFIPLKVYSGWCNRLWIYTRWGACHFDIGERDIWEDEAIS